MKLPRRIKLDIDQKYYNLIPAQQGDTARVLNFQILNNNIPFSLENKTVRARIKKPDGNVCYNDMENINASEGECDLKLTNQILIKPGMCKVQLEIMENGEILSTIIFAIFIRESIDIKDAAESTNEFTALENGIIKLDEWDRYFKETSGAIEEKYTERLNGIDSSLEETKNEVNSLNTSKVDKIEGKSLSTNDYDNVEKAKVATITNKAEKTTTDNLQSQVDNLVLHSGGDSNLEVAQARVDYVGNTFPTLKSKDDNVEKLLFEMSSIYNKITFEQGGTGTNGDYSTTNRLRSVGFFNINGTFSVEIDSSWKFNLLEYNNEGALVKNYGFTSNMLTVNGIVDNKFRIVLGKTNDSTITPDLASGILSILYTPNSGIFKELKETKKIKNTFIDKELLAFKNEYGYYQQGNFVSSSVNITYYYDVSDLKSINLTTTQVQYKNIYTLLSKEFNVIDYIRVNDASLTYNQEEINLNGACYIAISEPKNSPVNKKITYLSPVIKENTNNEQNHRWYGKKIVWLGTSIPAGGKEGKNNPLSYPMILGKRLGANVINEAVGESSLHCKAVHRISEANPYGFEENWNKCARCLTNTLEEVEWLLTNWNNTTVFTSGTLTTLTEEDKAFYRRCSFENKLLPHLESGDVDLFVLDHGHNDRYNANKKDGVSVDDSVIMEEYGEFNLYTFEGASNFIINKILTSNAENRICFIGEYENQKLPLVSQFQLKVAEKWLFPIYKQWEKLGWTQNKITTTGYWDNSTGLWVESGGEEQQITMLNRWVRDNIHPNSDNSGKAIKLLVDNMEIWFLYNV